MCQIEIIAQNQIIMTNIMGVVSSSVRNKGCNSARSTSRHDFAKEIKLGTALKSGKCAVNLINIGASNEDWPGATQSDKTCKIPPQLHLLDIQIQNNEVMFIKSSSGLLQVAENVLFRSQDQHCTARAPQANSLVVAPLENLGALRSHPASAPATPKMRERNLEKAYKTRRSTSSAGAGTPGLFRRTPSCSRRW